MWVGMVWLVAMDMVFPTGSAEIGRDGCWRKKKKERKEKPKPLQHSAASFFSFVEKLCILSALMTAHQVCSVI